MVWVTCLILESCPIALPPTARACCSCRYSGNVQPELLPGFILSWSYDIQLIFIRPARYEMSSEPGLRIYSLPRHDSKLFVIGYRTGHWSMMFIHFTNRKHKNKTTIGETTFNHLWSVKPGTVDDRSYQCWAFILTTPTKLKTTNRHRS